MIILNIFSESAEPSSGVMILRERNEPTSLGIYFLCILVSFYLAKMKGCLVFPWVGHCDTVIK